MVCTPLSSSGLRIRILRTFNVALLGKWLWRFEQERDALWRQVIEVKYGCDWGGWCFSSFSGPYGVSLWKNIRRGWPSLSWFILYEIGDGSKVQFWLDQWCGTSSLTDCYLEIYRICQNKEASVANLMRYTNGVLHWEIHFCRGVHNRELEAFWSFINTIYCTPVRRIGEDKRCWLPCKSKGFMVSVYYHLLVGHSEQFFPWKSIWKQKIPSKVAFFVWTAALGKCLTIDNLRKRKICILDWCYMCKCNSETVDHLFLHCPVVLELWDMVLGLFGVCWVMPMSIVELLACWQGRFGRHHNGDIWIFVPHCLMWCIWKERNNRYFEDNERSMLDLKLLFFRALLD